MAACSAASTATAIRNAIIGSAPDRPSALGPAGQDELCPGQDLPPELRAPRRLPRPGPDRAEHQPEDEQQPEEKADRHRDTPRRLPVSTGRGIGAWYTSAGPRHSGNGATVSARLSN